MAQNGVLRLSTPHGLSSWSILYTSWLRVRFSWSAHKFGVECIWKHFLRPALDLGDDCSSAKHGRCFGLAQLSAFPTHLKPRKLQALWSILIQASLNCTRDTTGKRNCRSSWKPDCDFLADLTVLCMYFAPHIFVFACYNLEDKKWALKSLGWFFAMPGLYPPNWAHIASTWAPRWPKLIRRWGQQRQHRHKIAVLDPQLEPT